MTRRDFLKTAAYLSTATAALLHCAKKVERPNIIYIMADDLGYGDLGCYGQKKFSTPNIDRMAAEGKVFTQHYAGSTVCAPSRASLMTGLHTGHTTIRGNKEYEPEGQHPLPAGTVTVASLLKQAGYATAATGKWGLGGPGTEGEPNNHGFDLFYGYLCQRQAHFYYQDHLWKNRERVDLPGNAGGKREQYTHDMIADQAIDFIKTNSKNPFFLYVPFTIPHAELAVPEDDLAAFRGKFPEEPYVGRHYGSQDYPHAAFAAMVTRMDRDVGRILDTLKELGLDENTIVFFTSDNGPHKEGGHDPQFFDSNGLLRGHKRDLYEGGIRVPFIARWPGKIASGTQSDHVSAFWDFLPTACELAGIEPPGDIDGISFVPALMDKSNQKKHDYLYWEFYEGGSKQAVRFGDWKAIRFNVKGKADGPIELYNLADDPGEQNDVADQHPELVNKARELLAKAHTENPIWKLEG